MLVFNLSEKKQGKSDHSDSWDFSRPISVCFCCQLCGLGFLHCLDHLLWCSKKFQQMRRRQGHLCHYASGFPSGWVVGDWIVMDKLNLLKYQKNAGNERWWSLIFLNLTGLPWRIEGSWQKWCECTCHWHEAKHVVKKKNAMKYPAAVFDDSTNQNCQENCEVAHLGEFCKEDQRMKDDGHGLEERQSMRRGEIGRDYTFYVWEYPMYGNILL